MFFSNKTSILGVDIGTTNIKIAQVTTKDNVHVLDTYGLVNATFAPEDKSDGVVPKTVAILKNLMEKAGVTTRKCVASLPNSAVFTSIIDMPRMSPDELSKAVDFEAKKYVPLPINEVKLSWSVLETGPDGSSHVLITAVPNTVLQNYISIFQMTKLEPLALEIEALALIRAVVGQDQGNNLLIDIGAKSTHLNITEKGNLVLNRNIPLGGETITQKIAESLKISLARAEQFKKDFGIIQSSLIPETIKPILMNIKNETLQLQTIYKSHGKTFDKIIIVGGGANLPGLKEFFGDMGQVVVGDPLSQLTFSPDIKPVLEQYSSNLAIAIGLALRTNK